MQSSIEIGLMDCIKGSILWFSLIWVKYYSILDVLTIWSLIFPFVDNELLKFGLAANWFSFFFLIVALTSYLLQTACRTSNDFINYTPNFLKSLILITCFSSMFVK